MTAGSGLIDARVLDAQAMRQAPAGLLSLALMDARNRTLGWLAAFDGLRLEQPVEGLDPPRWLAGQAGWFQEYWIARHVQRGRGEAADPAGLRLASIEPDADAWFNPQASRRTQRWRAEAPTDAALRDYLAATLDTTLELLDKAGPGDEALYFFRLALLHEDRLGEALAVLVQALGLAPERCQPLQQRGLWPDLASRGRREAIGLPGQGLMLGSPPGGLVPDAEKWAHAVAVADFEIDAQPVSWSQFAEFVDDGGYDDQHWWTDAGWQMLQATARRAPRYVEQMAGGVLAQRGGRLQRLPGNQPALHVTAHEADAWCRWAGRRLPSEAEWELAACNASARGFAWGELREWAAGTARPYPGADAAASAGSAGPHAIDASTRDGPAALDCIPQGARWRVQRGASAWASPRLRHARARVYADAQRDELFVGFRSCAA